MKDAEDTPVASLLNHNQLQLANTYFAFSGTGKFTSAGAYARIAGPGVWI